MKVQTLIFDFDNQLDVVNNGHRITEILDTVKHWPEFRCDIIERSIGHIPGACVLEDPRIRIVVEFIREP